MNIGSYNNYSLGLQRNNIKFEGKQEKTEQNIEKLNPNTTPNDTYNLFENKYGCEIRKSSGSHVQIIGPDGKVVTVPSNNKNVPKYQLKQLREFLHWLKELLHIK